MALCVYSYQRKAGYQLGKGCGRWQPSENEHILCYCQSLELPQIENETLKKQLQTYILGSLTLSLTTNLTSATSESSTTSSMILVSSIVFGTLVLQCIL